MDDLNTGAFLPYPVSTLSPRIIPNDLTSFKSKGISEIERVTQQKLIELKQEYDRVVEEFNWNKIVYESEFNFEPIIGEMYYLYEIRGKNTLSMIKPEEWGQKHLGSFRLSVDKIWVKV
jgi:hypothetical protein